MKNILLLAATIFCFTSIINAQAGQLDPSFGTNGVVKTDIGKNYTIVSVPAKQIIPLANGNMYVLESHITKRLSNGAIDSSFGDKGNFTDAGFYIQSLALQPDGKMVAVGSVQIDTNTNVLQSNYAVARFNTNGLLDSSFSGDGKLTTDFGARVDEFGVYSYDVAHAVTIQKDGKIVVAGVSNNNLSLARYNSNGNLDSTFDRDGLIKSNFTFYIGGVYTTSIALQNDQKIVVAGGFSIVRYNTNGSTDNTFKGTSSQQGIKSIVIQKNDKIVILGNSISRSNADGSWDKSFSGDAIRANTYFVKALSLQTDGKIVTAGLEYIQDSSGRTHKYFAISRYNTDGRADKSFSGDGKEITDFGVGDADAETVAIQPDGKIVAGGGTGFNSALAIARYNTDGSFDNTFDKDGKLIYSYSAGYTVYNRTAIQKNGKIVAVGFTWNGSDYTFVIVRYNTDGSLDKTFSKDGIQITPFTGLSNSNSVAIQDDGKIVVSNNYVLARFNADGSADSTFLTSTGRIRALAIQKDGKILIGGLLFSGGTCEVHRYNTNGVTDNTFGKGGSQTITFYDQKGSKLTGYTSSIAVQEDGKILVGAVAYNNSRDQASIGFITLARLSTNGSFDNTFSEDGKTSFNLSGADSCSVVVQNDGKIIVGGYFSDINTFSKGSSFKRYNTDGSIDTGFNSINISEPARVIALQSDDKIVLSGSALIRYNTDGSRDSTFSYSEIQTPATVNNIAIAGNKLYTVGFLSSPNQIGLVARYLLDGNSNTPLTVTLTSPANNTTYLAPAAHIKLSASANDKDGTITKVEFYNGTKLLHTETVVPYGYVWRNVPLGNYTITAKAYDNSGNVTTSAPVHISVVPNKAPVVSITSPADNQTYADTATIHLEAAASDTDGRITSVKFYSGTTLLRTEFTYPYTYSWTDAAAGTYTITAVATDNWGARTISAPVAITVTSARAMIVSNKPYLENGKTASKDALRLSLYPNPATNIVDLYIKGLQQSKAADISIVSVSGIVLKKIQINNAAQTQLDVSSLAKGVYTIKIVSGDKILYRKFVKL